MNQTHSFLKDFLKKIEPFQWIPFSDGSRDCLGKNVSMTEATVVISMIIQKYTIHLDENIKEIDKYLQVKSFVFCEPKNENLKIIFKERV